jgi:hypothetical protein
MISRLASGGFDCPARTAMTNRDGGAIKALLCGRATVTLNVRTFASKRLQRIAEEPGPANAGHRLRNAVRGRGWDVIARDESTAESVQRILGGEIFDL